MVNGMNLNQKDANMIATALAGHFVSMYYVDIETGHFKQMVQPHVTGVSGMPEEGDDFFSLAKENAPSFVDAADLDKLLVVYGKKAILKRLENNVPLVVECRVLAHGVVEHVRQVTLLCEDKKHILCCLENIDREYLEKAEQEKNLRSAERKANIDALTGIKNRNAFLESLEEINGDIIKGKSTKPFAVLVCDVNGLKHINDTRGHSFGDEVIKRAARMICETFKHSPVFRTGGDEFVAVLTDGDYEKRDKLLEALREVSLKNAKTRTGPEVASGMAEYRAGIDKNFNNVYERADAEMYENKKAMKANKVADSIRYTGEKDSLITDERKRLLDGMFGALYTVAGESYIYINDLRYDYSRWSLKLVNDFGLKSEYMYHADKIWHDYIHPDDMESYDEAVEAVLRGDMELRPLVYRARKADGTYAILSTRGFVLTDSAGEPEYFGGIIIPH
ncbi:diguanylate cyclase (GGDEF) domain-containing protein [Lachnospiraceae bacterium YSD2013]|nr:diguanylate cyclase (GGDEF) domain-containing protein [Lachnospiraceae bacterium YSD2013]